MKKTVLAILCLFVALPGIAQKTSEIIEQVNIDSLVKTVRELSGEDSALIDGDMERIKHRVSRWGNNLAAAYIKQRFEEYGIEVFQHDYRNGGRSILGTIKGTTNPDSIYIMCAHYDAVADYCADDNATGTAAVLETARLLKDKCLENTLIFALWDEEERGLIGAKYYANLAFGRGDAIKGVFNMDMMGYDSDTNFVFDIHTTSEPYNQALKDSMLYLVDTLNLKLVPQVINPGTNRSDHAAFWAKGYPAVFFGESFLGGDPTPHYHKPSDRISTLNLDYYHELAKLATAVVREYVGIVPPERDTVQVTACEEFMYSGRTYTESGFYSDTLANFQGCDSIHTLDLTIIHINDSVTRDDRVLTAVDSQAKYQWINCTSNLTVLWGDTLQSFTVNQDGSYAVELTKGKCKDTSMCFELNVSSVDSRNGPGPLRIFPNPTRNSVVVQKLENPRSDASLEVYDSKGRLLETVPFDSRRIRLLKDEQPGVYIIRFNEDGRSLSYRVVKQ